MKFIQVALSKNKYTIIDSEDAERVLKYKWCLMGKYAGRRTTRKKPPRRTILLHRFLIDAPKGSEVDHINKNRLDNRKTNLRICKHGDNIKNSKLYSNNSSGYRGVYYNQNLNRWYAQIRVNNKTVHLGMFKDIYNACLIYKQVAKKVYKEFAQV